MTETPKTAEQVISGALRRDRLQTTEHMEGAQIAINALRDAGLLRTPGEPSDEQVELAARALNPGAWSVRDYGLKSGRGFYQDELDLMVAQSLKDARAALKAAAVTPHEPTGERARLIGELRTAPIVGSAWRRLLDRAADALATPQPGCCTDDTNVLDASMTQVDEAALAEAVEDAIRVNWESFNNRQEEALIIAHALIENRAAWLKDGAR